jgi:NADH:ubiquinone oxidoreductase subunit B-like Fe-S oxidoreductase
MLPGCQEDIIHAVLKLQKKLEKELTDLQTLTFTEIFNSKKLKTMKIKFKLDYTGEFSLVNSINYNKSFIHYTI